MIRRQPPLWRMVLLAAVVVGIDRWTKQWVQRTLALGESRHVTPFFYLTHVHNTGSAFGLFQNNNRALVIVALVILSVLFYSARGIYEQAGKWGEVGVGLILGGAIGNLIDRFQYGHVVDFLDFRVWPVFNVADSAITVGAIGLVVGLSLRRPNA